MRHTDEISNSEDVIDSRNVIARIEHLESEMQAIHEGADTDAPDFEDWLRVDDSDEANELKALRALAAEGEDSPDWTHGEALIRDSYFEEYAQQFADDIGAIDRNATWPLCHIDWKAAADSLKSDYISVDFDGVEYWIRA